MISATITTPYGELTVKTESHTVTSDDVAVYGAEAVVGFSDDVRDVHVDLSIRGPVSEVREFLASALRQLDKAAGKSGTGPTVEDVELLVAAIAAKAPDDEEQHAAEDKLYRLVLTAISNGAENAAELARAALETKSLEFSRWYA